VPGGWQYSVATVSAAAQDLAMLRPEIMAYY
jgi:hypothetical protein